MSLQYLPNDVLIDLFCYLDVKDVAIATRSCRHARNNIFGNNLFWYRYLSTVYLYPRIVDSSVHYGPMTIECFLSNRKPNPLASIDKICCKSVNDLASFGAYHIQRMAHRPVDWSLVSSTSSSICERSIDLRELRRHLDLWEKYGILSVAVHPFIRDEMSYLLTESSHVDPSIWTKYGRKCFHLKHYTKLARPLFDTDQDIGAYDSAKDYRRIVFEHMFSKMRNELWPPYAEDALTGTTTVVHNLCAELMRLAPAILAKQRERKRLIDRFQTLPGDTPPDPNPLAALPHFGDDTETIHRLLVNAGLWKLDSTDS